MKDDLIKRQDAINALWKSHSALDILYVDWVVNLLEKMPSAEPDNQVHLCGFCKYSYPECPAEGSDVIFGNGIGHDNVCACAKFEIKPEWEIIHCKDCKFYTPMNRKLKTGICSMTMHHLGDDGFCSDAERRGK